MIEDNANYVSKINKLGIKTILIKQPYNIEYKHKLNTFAENWLDVYDIFSQVYKFDDEIISF